MKGKTKKLACYMLVFSLLITSMTTAYINKPTPVKGGELVLAYTAEEVIMSILLGLGLSIEATNMLAQTDSDGVTKFARDMGEYSNNIHAPLQQGLDLTTQGIIDTAMQTGQVVVDSSSGVWDAFKAYAKDMCENIKNLSANDSSEIDNISNSAYNLGRLAYDNSSSFVKYASFVAKRMYNKFGINVTSNTISKNFAPASSNCYSMMFALRSNASDSVCVYSFTFWGLNSAEEDMKNTISLLKSKCVSFDSKITISEIESCVDCYTYTYDISKSLTVGNVYGSMYGQLCDIVILSPSGMDSFFELENTIGLSSDYIDNYDIVYHPPTVGDVTHAYDIITPENTAEKDEDGTYKIGGAYVIDVANPVTYPVDLTDGQTIPDEKSEIGTIPITDIVKVNEKTDTGNEDNKTEDTDNTGGTTKPIVPDVSSGDIPNMAVLKTLFPFCIPFDIADSIKLMQADAVAPKWTIKINIPIGKKTIPFEFTIDMSILDEQVKIFRDGQVVIFIIGLAFATTKVIKWGASEE